MAFEPVPDVGAPAYAEHRVLLPPHLTGNVVLELRAELLHHASDRRVGNIVVDCAAVEELAPYALTVIIAASRTARAHGGSLEVVHPTAVVAAALDRFGLHKVLTVLDHDSLPRR
jgi:anti-anti-sigma factor